MFSRKFLALGLAVFALCAIAICYAGKLYLESLPQDRARTIDTGFEPCIPDVPAMLIMDERSGTLWQQVLRNPRTQLITSVDVGFTDGRSGRYSFENGRLKSFQGFEEKHRLSFEAQYEPGGLIACYKILREDGTTATLFRRLSDGTEEVNFLDRSANCLKSIVTARDGSQTITERPDPTKEAKVSQLKAAPSEQQHGPITLADGSKSWRFKFKLIGVRLSEWEYRDAKGTLRHSGKFTENGNVEITILDDAAKPVLKQTWICIGEDWGRRIYRLCQLEKFSSYSGEPEGSILLYPDGITPKEVTNYNYGQKTREFYNEKGIKIHLEYYDTNGFSNGGYDMQPGSQEKSVLPPSLTGEPSDKDGPIYRLNGTPYSLPVPAEGNTISPLFVLPR